MAFRTSELFDRHMPSVTLKVNAIRWVAVLLGSVFLLVLILLRQPDQSVDSDVNTELTNQLNEEASRTRWSIPRAQTWYSSQPWLVGANYLPSTSVNVLEMWQEDTFDVKTIQQELERAHQRLGMNVLRVFLHFLIWAENADKFYQRFETFLGIAKKNNIRIVPVLFDECWNAESKLGKQPEPIPGVHNSQWVRCPGQAMLLNRTSWPLLAQYTIETIHRYRSDERIVFWDLYNEPECSKQVKIVLPLLRYIYGSARSVKDVQQPMTIGIAKWPLTSPLATFELAVSDIISFHSYGSLTNIVSNVTDLRLIQAGRPILCTEWLARPFGSTIFTHLDYFQYEKIGAIQWGLVAGRSQTYYPWKSPRDAPVPRLWFHDLFYPNGTAFNPFEEKFFFDIVKRQS